MDDGKGNLSRRAFLRLGGACLAATPLVSAAVPGAGAAPAPDGSFKDRLRGPILSIPTVYTADYRVDYAAIERMVDRAVRAGVGAFALTAGNSQYDRLTAEETREVTRVMVKAVGGKGLTIAATGPWWTGPAVEYARFAESVGADAVQVMKPQEGDEESWHRHYKSVAEATRLPLVVHCAMTLPLVIRLADIESIVAMKAEFTIELTASCYAALQGRWNIFQGGQKSHFLAFVSYGMQAYYSTFSSFAPEAAMDFWRIFQTEGLRKAGDWVLKYDVPFFERWSNPFWRATLEYFGVASRHPRPPEKTFTDGQMAEVRRFFEGIRLEPR